MYIQLDFLIRRFAQQAADDPSLRELQPYKAAAEGDLRWFGEAVTKHYQGDDSDVKPLVAAVLSAHEAITVDEHAGRVRAFFGDAEHPTLGRSYRSCGYRPMIELLRYLEANGFTTYIASGGDRDFMRSCANPSTECPQPGQGGRLDGRQRQGRLGNRLRRPVRPLEAPGSGDYFWSMRTRLPDGSRTAQSRGPHG
jgi:hypothetical protein